MDCIAGPDYELNLPVLDTPAVYLKFPHIKKCYWKARQSVRAFFYKDVGTFLGVIKILYLCLIREGSGGSCDQRQLAVLAWYFPPIISGGVYRTAALSRYAVNAGWDLLVVAGPPPEPVTHAGAYLLKQLPDKLNTIRIHPLGLKLTDSILPTIDGGFTNVVETFSKVVAKYGKSSPSAVLASGPPFHNFIAAALLARYYGCRLVLEYRDEWSECPFSFVEKGRTDRLWESFCLSKASAVIFSTEAQLDHVKTVFPVLAKKRCEVIHNGWEPNDVIHTEVTCSTKPDSHELSLAFVGNLADHTLPQVFLSTLSLVLRDDEYLRKFLKVMFVGHKSSAALRQLSNFPYQDNVQLVGQLAKPEALGVMHNADGLLLLNNQALHRYIPGKLFDYISAGPPVLVYGQGGEVGRIVSQLNAGLIVKENEVDELKKALYLVATFDRNVTVVKESWLSEHTREVLAKQVLKLIHEVVTPSRFGRQEPRGSDEPATWA